MTIRAVLIATLLSTAGSPAQAADWAYGLLSSSDHDFGRVKRGEKRTHRFTLTNNLSKEVRIRDVSVSCNCTKATVETKHIQPGESVDVVAVMDTAGFQGTKSVGIHVQFDRPRRARIMLRVSCVSVGDLVTGTTEIDFGVLPAGTASVKKMRLDYAGKPNWQIVGLDYGNPVFAAEVAELSRDAESVHYELKVSLKKDAKPGMLEDRLRIRTNDPQAPEIFVAVKAKVEADIVVAPQVLRFAGASPGSSITRNLIIKAPNPFKVLRVDNTKGMIQVRSSPDPRTAQLIVLTVKIPEDMAELPEQIDIVTNIEGERSVPVTLVR